MEGANVLLHHAFLSHLLCLELRIISDFFCCLSSFLRALEHSFLAFCIQQELVIQRRGKTLLVR